jgi:alpha-beta hydrolase superfamily lysophospholipase
VTCQVVKQNASKRRVSGSSRPGESSRLKIGSKPVFLLGHSAGGVVSSVYTVESQAELAGFICENFAFQVPAPGFAGTAAGLKMTRVIPTASDVSIVEAELA